MRGLLALFVGVMAIVAFAASAGAVDSSPCPPGQPPGRPPGSPPNQPAQPAGRPPAYPPGECSLALSQSAAARGQTVQASGSGYAPGETVTVRVAGQSVGSVVADGIGAFSMSFVVPADAPLGRTQVLASGASRELSAAFEVLAAAEASRGSAADARQAAALSTTGVNASRLAFTGVALVLIGTVLVIVVRRRRAFSVG